ncbi:metallophosphoesterase family protein [Flaviflagellibacter deserti]|uniref:Metallophosphoesterase family protein n=1 Tax=Flaviflagellibacter deserti TaxID=2267266 RepID=A0ABV9Z0K1_9HYPH
MTALLRSLSKTTYVVSDLHGRFDLLEAALAKIEEAEPGTVVFTGDYIDRGPASRQIIARLMAGPPVGWRWICLMGNHEQMMLETIRKPLEPDWWLSNGGFATMASYGKKVPDAHLDWIAALPRHYEDQHRIYVHAGCVSTFNLECQPDQLLWFRCERDEDYSYRGKHVIHGHTPFHDGPVCLKGRTNLDTLAWKSGRLVVGVFEDVLAGGPISLIEVTEHDLSILPQAR